MVAFDRKTARGLADATAIGDRVLIARIIHSAATLAWCKLKVEALRGPEIAGAPPEAASGDVGRRGGGF